MTNQIPTQTLAENISAMMDGQLSEAELDRTLKQINTPSAKEQWDTYHAIGEILRANEQTKYSHSQTQKNGQNLHEIIMQQIAEEKQSQEQQVLKQINQVPAANDGIWKIAAGVATFAFVALLGWNILGQSPQTIQTMSGGQLAQIEKTQPSQENQKLPQLPQTQQNIVLTAAGDTQAKENDEQTELMRLHAPLQAAPAVILRDARLDAILAAHEKTGGTTPRRPQVTYVRNASN